MVPPKTAPVKIKKVLTGETNVVDQGRKYSGTVTCSNGGKTITGTWEKKAGEAATEVVFANGAKATVGSDCTATEKELSAPSTDPSYVFETPSHHRAQEHWRQWRNDQVTNKVTRNEGNLKVAKTVIDPDNGFRLPGIPVFAVEYVCSNPADAKARPIED